MHPDVCAFVSERSYDARLHSRDACATRRDHGDRRAPSPAAVCARSPSSTRAEARRAPRRQPRSPPPAPTCSRARPSPTTKASPARSSSPTSSSSRRTTSPCTASASTCPPGVRVGTVDRFQGQQAPVVFYAMTCSAGEDVPRGVDFLFDAHRFNVAISRAQCLAVLVHSPRLLDTECHSLETMALVDGACRYLELGSDMTRATRRPAPSATRTSPVYPRARSACARASVRKRRSHTTAADASSTSRCKSPTT